MRAKESGVVRKAATHAIGAVTVKGNGIVPKGSQFSTASGILFESTSEHVVKGTQQIEVRAVEPGTSGNVNANTITTISMSIPGIISVNNVEATSDGFEEETDDMLRERYLLHVRYPGTSGNTMHYYEWAMSIPGVGDAKVIPVWNGPGTVKVIIVNSEFKPASDKLVKAVKDYIETVRPTTAMVTVASAINKPINVSVTIEGRDFNLSTFKDLMRGYLIELEKMVITRDEKVKLSIAKIGSLILDAGAVDYQNLRINNSDKSIVINVDDLPILGAVNIQ